MDSKQSSKGAKKSQSSSSRKKKKQKKRESQSVRYSEQSPGAGGKPQREKDVVGAQPGLKDSGADTDSRDSGLEVDCRPQSANRQPTEVANPFLIAKNQRELLICSIDHEPRVKGTQDNKCQNTASSKEELKSNANRVKQNTSKQWLLNSNNGGLPDKSSQVSKRRVLSTHQSLPNIPSSQTGGEFPKSQKYCEFNTSNSATSKISPNSTSPTVAQTKIVSLRWENALEDSDEEADRIRTYKLNRRKRYIAASNKKYEEWLSSCSNTSLSCSSGSNRGRKSASDVEQSEGKGANNDNGRGICATMMASHHGNIGVGNMYDEFSQLVMNSHSQTNTNQRILLNC